MFVRNEQTGKKTSIEHPASGSQGRSRQKAFLPFFRFEYSWYIYITIFVGLFTEVKMIMLLGFIRHHCSILHLSKNLFFAILQCSCQVETSQSLM